MKIQTIVIAVIVFAIAGTTIAWQAERIQELKVEKSQVIEFAKKDSIALVYYKTKAGKEVAKSKQLTLSLDNTQKLIGTERLSWIRQFEGVNHRLNNLEHATRATAVAVANFKIPLGDTTILLPDSTVLRARKFTNNNKWIELTGLVLPDTVSIVPRVTVPIEEVFYWQRKKILFLRIGKKEYFSDITSPNPYVKFIQNEVLRIEKKK